MSCTATFVKEIPVDCVMQLIAQVRNKANYADLLVTSGQCLGQLGTVLGGTADGTLSFAATFEEPATVEDCCVLLERLVAVPEGTSASFSALTLKMLIATILRLLIKELL